MVGTSIDVEHRSKEIPVDTTRLFPPVGHQPVFTLERGRHVVGHGVDHELRVVWLADDLQRRDRQANAHRQAVERVVRADRVVRGLETAHQLKRRHAAIERRRVGRILREARVGPLRDVPHRRDDVAFDQPGLQEIVRHHVDGLFAGPRDPRQREW